MRHRYRGELIVLADRGHGRPEAAPDPAWTLLERPFSAVDLGTALGMPGLDAATAPGPKAEPGPRPRPTGTRRSSSGPRARSRPRWAAPPTPRAPADVKAAARRAPSWAPFAAAAGSAQAGLVDRVSRAVVALTEGWQAKRRVRVAGFSIFALVAFTVAFALAAQGRCGPGCDALGTAFSPAPTVAPASSNAPTTTGPKRPTTTTTARAPSGTSALRGVSGGRPATTTTVRRATTTTVKPTGGGSWDDGVDPAADDAAVHDASTHDRTNHGTADDDRTARHLASTAHPHRRAPLDTRSVATIAASPSRSDVCGR